MRYEEDLIQQSVVKYARAKYPKLVFTCAPATSKSAQEGSKKKKMGYRPGWPDLFFAYPSQGYNGLMIELKTPRGVISSDQVATIAALQDLGYKAVVCRSDKEACDVLDKYIGR